MKPANGANSAFHCLWLHVLIMACWNWSHSMAGHIRKSAISSWWYCNVLHLIQSQATEHTHSFAYSNWNLYRYKVPILTGRPRRHDAACCDGSDYGMSYGREMPRKYWPMLILTLSLSSTRRWPCTESGWIRAICRSFPFLAASWHWGARSLNWSQTACRDKWCDEISTFRDREGPATIATIYLFF
jgi:hypothetical protein